MLGAIVGLEQAGALLARGAMYEVGSTALFGLIVFGAYDIFTALVRYLFYGTHPAYRIPARALVYTGFGLLGGFCLWAVVSFVIIFWGTAHPLFSRIAHDLGVTSTTPPDFVDIIPAWLQRCTPFQETWGGEFGTAFLDWNYMWENMKTAWAYGYIMLLIALAFVVLCGLGLRLLGHGIDAIGGNPIARAMYAYENAYERLIAWREERAYWWSHYRVLYPSPELLQEDNIRLLREQEFSEAAASESDKARRLRLGLEEQRLLVRQPGETVEAFTHRLQQMAARDRMVIADVSHEAELAELEDSWFRYEVKRIGRHTAARMAWQRACDVADAHGWPRPAEPRNSVIRVSSVRYGGENGYTYGNS